MTRTEQITIQKLSQKLNAYITEDNKWKKKMEEDLAPILKERNNSKIIKEWWRTSFHIIAGVITFIISIGVVIHYIVEPVVGLFRR